MSVRRLVWTGAGLVSVGLGGVGIVVPGLPTTIFFIIAAGCFSRSSPRLEQWVLGLPRIGEAVRRHRAGEGMSRSAKRMAISSIVVFSLLAVALAIDSPVWRAVVLVAAAVGLGVVVRQPTYEPVPGDGAPPASAGGAGRPGG